MKIFLDTANREVIKKWLPTGLVDGITTNPSHLSKEGSDTKQVLKEICSLVKGPVSIEVVEKKPDDVYRQAQEIASFASNVIVKIPCHQDYYPVIKKLADEKIKMNITLVFSPLQAMFVSKLGVTMISPFLGRLDDIGVSGLDLLDQTITIKHQYQFESEILAASVRSVLQWQQVAHMGADIITVPITVFEKAMQHPLTDQGIKKFDADWQKLGKKNLFY